MDITQDEAWLSSANSELERCFHLARKARTPLVLAGLTAIALMGLPPPWNQDRDQLRVTVCASPQQQRSKQRDIRAIYWSLPFFTSTITCGDISMNIVDPVTACLQSLRDISKEEAVVLFDSLLARGANRKEVSKQDLECLINTNQRFVGKASARWALERCREGTDSPMESRLRIKLIQHHFPCPQVNYMIQHPQTGEIWLADLAYPELKIAIEYQGVRFHTSKESLKRDSRKSSALQGMKWNLIPVTSEDILDQTCWNRFTDTLESVIVAQSARYSVHCELDEV
ncbi:MAG: hypothetical protein ABF780_04795 [Bifidobacterium aquikefiri]|uniref:DUF559 domain-containing protein n=1 Tax=Bifidobacterium aquikefiri TaxID=1653207 RepID=A0A261G6L3_9BIFI|nr:hypothetical protein [Bifidobacterium aquikefiri]OZG67042.1 hypothetical protein BAQU_1114 [Bifidobacterium aquikefiri]